MRARRCRRRLVSMRLAMPIGRPCCEPSPTVPAPRAQGWRRYRDRPQHAERAAGTRRQGQRAADTSAAYGADGVRAWRREPSGARSHCTRWRRERRRRQRDARRGHDADEIGAIAEALVDADRERFGLIIGVRTRSAGGAAAHTDQRASTSEVRAAWDSAFHRPLAGTPWPAAGTAHRKALDLPARPPRGGGHPAR